MLTTAGAAWRTTGANDSAICSRERGTVSAAAGAAPPSARMQASATAARRSAGRSPASRRTARRALLPAAPASGRRLLGLVLIVPGPDRPGILSLG